MIATLSGCGAAPSENGDASRPDSQQSAEKAEATIPNETEGANNMESGTTSKNLVVYFSMPETTAPNNMSQEEELSTVIIDSEVLGNTQYASYVIEQNTGADVFRIEPVTQYPLEHTELEEIAQKEQQENARPEIAGIVENIEQYDLSGKTIVPFVTSGGSGFSDAISTIEQMEPDADVITDWLSISSNLVQDSEQEIIKWLTNKRLIQ